MTVERVHERTSIALTRSMAYHPEVQHHVAEMRIDLEAIDAYLDRIADDWSTGVDHGPDWPVEDRRRQVRRRSPGAWRVVDTALDLTGGGGIFKRSRLEQMFRDARLGRIHPAQLAARPTSSSAR